MKKLLVALFCILCLFISPLECYPEQIKIDSNVINFLINLSMMNERMDTCKYIIESELWKGRVYVKRTFQFYFKKPYLNRMEILEGPNKGRIVVCNKEGKIRITSLFGIVITLNPKDNRLKDIRGNMFIRSSMAIALDDLKEKILKRICQTVLLEEDKHYRLHLEHNDIENPVTSEDIWFDKETYRPIRAIEYEGNKKVVDIKWLNFEINTSLDSNLFEL